MRVGTLAAILAVTTAVGGCGAEPSKPQDSNLVNATETDQAFPSGAQANDIFTGEDTAGAGSTNVIQSNAQQPADGQPTQQQQ